MKRNARRLSEEVLQIAKERGEVKSKVDGESYIQLNTEFHRIAKREKEGLLNEHCKEVEKNNRMGKTRDFKKIRDTKGTFHAKMGTIKDRNCKDIAEKKSLRRGGKNTQKKCTKKIFTTQIITMV